MKIQTMPNAGIDVSAVALGLMRINDKSDAEIRNLYAAARESGINFFDNADIYGPTLHACEARFGGALKLSSSEREHIIIQTKAGIVKDQGYYDFSYDPIMQEVNDSLAALRTDYIDILLLHRPDALAEPEEVARAFSDLQAGGKVRFFGVSNHTPRQIDLLKMAVRQPIVANQMQLSMKHSFLVAQGIAANMREDQAVVRDGGGLVDYCRVGGITLQAWSPMQSGEGGLVLDHERYPELMEVVDHLATKYGVTPEAIATAWITRHPANIQVILGTTSPQRVRDSAAGADVVLTRAEWYAIFRAAGWIIP